MKDRSTANGAGYPFDRLVAGIEEQRLELGLSRAKAAKLTGLSAGMVHGLERGTCHNWTAALGVRTALTMLELSAPPQDRDLAEALTPMPTLFPSLPDELEVAS